jgi:hypothetical protein
MRRPMMVAGTDNMRRSYQEMQSEYFKTKMHSDGIAYMVAPLGWRTRVDYLYTSLYDYATGAVTSVVIFSVVRVKLFHQAKQPKTKTMTIPSEKIVCAIVRYRPRIRT